MTCGNAKSKETWMNRQTGKLEPVGCLCYVPAKNSMPEADCYLYSRLGSNSIGWPDELNGSYAIQRQRNTPVVPG